MSMNSYDSEALHSHVSGQIVSNAAAMIEYALVSMIHMYKHPFVTDICFQDDVVYDVRGFSKNGMRYVMFELTQAQLILHFHVNLSHNTHAAILVFSYSNRGQFDPEEYTLFLYRQLMDNPLFPCVAKNDGAECAISACTDSDV